ncbi:uncharacterized protein N7484_006210 [Penicillium longicatenatum]|uniref:uncharacterized protein n=1 Tax=Penicillium longicatenatum TaxID=1561947 RepID=UPI002547A41F|nr:uncharacterized protein N7484_006210 [Penicillium longicatenatum]KAJ5643703.1 hypothetical protein N7484_006210 [Penicillium longicatenatum]
MVTRDQFDVLLLLDYPSTEHVIYPEAPIARLIELQGHNPSPDPPPRNLTPTNSHQITTLIAIST